MMLEINSYIKAKAGFSRGLGWILGVFTHPAMTAVNIKYNRSCVILYEGHNLAGF